MSYTSLLEAVRIAGLNNKAAGEVFSYLANNGGTAAQLQSALQQMGACWAGGAERLSWDIANTAGYAEIRAALVACGAAHDGAADLLAYELTQAAAPVPPGTNLFVRYSAQNLDGLNNSSLVDGQGMGTVVNLGSAGASYNQTQAVGANQPLYRAIAQSGKINNRPALEGDGSRGMQTGAIGALVQPTTMFAMVKVKSSQAAAMITDTSVSQMQWGFISLQTRLFAGSAALTGQSVTIGSWQLVVAQFNGASSFGRMDGAQSGAINAGGGAGGTTEMDFFQSAGGAFRLDAFIAEFMLYSALLTGPQIALVEAYFAAMYGVTPQ